MSENWPYNIKHVTPGEPVQAGIVGRPDRALQDRTDYLKQRLDAAELGRAVFDNDATIASDVLPGQPVFWNHLAKRYEKALAAVEVDTATQAYVVQPSAECVGLCFKKKTATLGDIVLYGVVDLPELQNGVSGTVQPGRYYLSAVEPGKLVKQRPGVTVNVCYVQGATDECNPVPRVVVMPNTRELVDEHTHYRFELVARPAGTNVVYVADGKERHRIDNASDSLAGWLPANHAVFNGKAPNGAVFGYNLLQHPALENAWPPIPIQAVSVLLDKGTGYVGATDVPTGLQGLVVCDLNGIWWMSDCRGDVPWPENYTNTYTPPANIVTPPECPRAEAMRVSVVFIRMLVGNDRNVVTSLVPGTDSPVVIERCASDEPVTDAQPGTGDLRLNLDLQYAVPNDVREAGDGLAEAGLIVTGKNDTGRRLQRGWVAAGLIAHNLPQLSVESTNARVLTTTEKNEFDIPVTDVVQLHRGLIKLNFAPLAESEISPQIVRLSDAVERLFMDIPYLGFPEGQASSLRLRFNVPDASLGAPTQMFIRVQLFGKGSAAQPLPALTMSYRLLQRPGTTPATSLALPSADTPLAFNSALAVAPNRAVVCDSASFTVSAGDTVLVTLARQAGGSYPEVGVLRVAGIISAVT